MSGAAPPLSTLHATTIARRVGGAWAGVLLRGASGAGKSDLALRALQHGWRLVADDRTLVWTSGPHLFARAPPRLAGLVEARQVGVLPAACCLACVELRLVVDCVATSVGLERIPEPQTASLAGERLPILRLAALEASAPAKLQLALAAAIRGEL